MLLISHRGNLLGRKPDRENTISYINEALDKGFNVEVDVWQIGNKLFLGHDNIQESVDIKFLQDSRLWVHCKTIKTLETCVNNEIHCFFHEIDDVALTSKQYLWVYPSMPIGKYGNRSILVMLSYTNKIPKCLGICSDFVELYKK
jgi:hypothetical protein